jgi:hypothetical protein
LEYVFLVSFVIVLGSQLSKAWHRRQLGSPQEKQPAAPPATASEPDEPDEPAAANAPGEPDAPLATALPEPALADRLHELERVLVPFGSSCAHPRELAEQVQFQYAVGLLEDEEVDLDTVVRYAVGADWALACAALAALAKRDDGNMPSIIS